MKKANAFDAQVSGEGTLNSSMRQMDETSAAEMAQDLFSIYVALVTGEATGAASQ